MPSPVAETETGEPKLQRTVGPLQLTFYALGSMIGSGIYGLIGQAAGQAGSAVWLAFLVALVGALLTALSYASLGSRYPRAGGAAYVAHRAFGSQLVSFVTGFALIASGVTSVATQAKIFAANIAALTGVSFAAPQAIAIGFLLILSGIVFRGIREAMWFNVLCTIIEASGLLIVIAACASSWGTQSYFEIPPNRADQGLAIVVLQASVLTFFAFIGFEDAINIAEECKNPSRTIPIGLISASLIAALLYVAVAISAVSVVPWRDLAAAPAPLTEVMSRAAPAFPPVVMTSIALFSVANTALVNYVTASRLIYGMSRQGLVPEQFGRIHPTRLTPHIATGALLLLLLPLALLGSIADLASATVLLLLVVFTTVNAALFVLKRRPGEARGAFELPSALPLLGCVVCSALIVIRISNGDWTAPTLAMSLILAAVLIFVLFRPNRTE